MSITEELEVLKNEIRNNNNVSEDKIVKIDKYDSRNDTKKHIKKVKKYLFKFEEVLSNRGELHDNSKLKEPELSTFNEYTPKLKNSTYGSDEYKSFLKEMKVALDHHYANNSHHPEYYENGIDGMNLVDLIEMICDWYAATKRHDDGDIIKSIGINTKRFKISPQLVNILKNTVDDIFDE